MAVILELILIIAAIVAIISFFKPNDKEDKVDEARTGLYETELEIDGEKMIVNSIVTLITEYEDDKIRVYHDDILTEISDTTIIVNVVEQLHQKHTLINKSDVKWTIKN